jgi:hypothetical protein
MRKLLTLLLLSAVCFSACKQKQEDILANIKKTTEETDASLKKYTKRQACSSS